MTCLILRFGIYVLEDIKNGIFPGFSNVIAAPAGLIEEFVKKFRSGG